MVLKSRNNILHRLKTSESELKDLNRNLESIVSTRTEEYRKARIESEQANKAKSQFLANMSHEIRTPINGIKGFISLLSQSKLDHAQQRYVDIVLKSTGDLTNIVNEILDFSKMESGSNRHESVMGSLYYCSRIQVCHAL